VHLASDGVRCLGCNRAKGRGWFWVETFLRSCLYRCIGTEYLFSAFCSRPGRGSCVGFIVGLTLGSMRLRGGTGHVVEVVPMRQGMMLVVLVLFVERLCAVGFVVVVWVMPAQVARAWKLSAA
jgi:hypothetical protein